MQHSSRTEAQEPCAAWALSALVLRLTSADANGEPTSEPPTFAAPFRPESHGFRGARRMWVEFDLLL